MKDPDDTPATSVLGAALPTTTAAIRAAEDAWQVPTYAKLPVALVRGQGSFVWDADGVRYLDLYGGHCVASVGHGHPAVVAALREQAGRLLFYSNVAYSDTRALAAQRVAALAPEGLRRVFFCNSGTEANEVALKIARRHTGRQTVLSMADGFHGRTLGALGATGSASYRHPTYCTPEQHVHVTYGELAAVAGAFSEAAAAGAPLAAVMLEPIPSMGGIRRAPDDYFAGLADLCHRHGALLIYDEVQSGFGRTGTPFLGDSLARPDLITGAKGAAGGFPAGVVLVREDIADAIRPGEHGTTFGGGPLACAALAATAGVIVDEDLPAHAAELGSWLIGQLSALAGVRSVGGQGLLLGIDLDRPAKPVVAALREQHHVLTGGCSDLCQIRLMPPLVLTREEVTPFVGALQQVLAAGVGLPEDVRSTPEPADQTSAQETGP